MQEAVQPRARQGQEEGERAEKECSARVVCRPVSVRAWLAAVLMPVPGVLAL